MGEVLLGKYGGGRMSLWNIVKTIYLKEKKNIPEKVLVLLYALVKRFFVSSMQFFLFVFEN